MAETVVDHVRLGRELRMRAVPDELRDRKPPLTDVLVEDAIGERTFCGDEVHVRLVLDAPAQMTQLWNVGLCDGQLTLRLEIGLAGVLDVQLIELRADVAPDACFLGGVFHDRRAQPLEAMTPAQREQLAAPGDIALIAETRMPRLELELGRLHRRHHRLGIDGHAVLGQHRLFSHGLPRVASLLPVSTFPASIANSGPQRGHSMARLAAGCPHVVLRTPAPARPGVLLQRGYRRIERPLAPSAGAGPASPTEATVSTTTKVPAWHAVPDSCPAATRG